MEKEKKVYTFLPFFTGVILILAAVCYASCGVFAHFVSSEQTILVLMLGMLYFIGALALFAGTIMTLILNVAQNKGATLITDAPRVYNKYRRTYLWADDLYVCFLCLWNASVWLPFAVVYNPIIPKEICSYLIWATIVMAVFVYIRILWITIKRSKH